MKGTMNFRSCKGVRKGKRVCNLFVEAAFGRRLPPAPVILHPQRLDAHFFVIQKVNTISRAGAVTPDFTPGNCVDFLYNKKMGVKALWVRDDGGRR